MTVNDLAKFWNCTVTTVYRYCKMYDISIKRGDTDCTTTRAATILDIVSSPDNPTRGRKIGTMDGFGKVNYSLLPDAEKYSNLSDWEYSNGYYWKVDPESAFPCEKTPYFILPDKNIRKFIEVLENDVNNKSAYLKVRNFYNGSIEEVFCFYREISMIKVRGVKSK